MQEEVSRLFHELTDLSPQERARYWERYSIEPAIRAEVESLLTYDSPLAPDLSSFVRMK